MAIHRSHDMFILCLTGFMLLTPFTGMAQAQAQQDKLSVAVIEFEVKGDLGIKDAGVIIAEWMISAIGKTQQFHLRERALLKKVLEEQQLELSGAVDEKSTFAEVGKIYGVEGIITGSVLKWGDVISVTARLIDTRTGTILKTADIKTNDVNVIPDKINDIALVLAGESPPKPPPPTVQPATPSASKVPGKYPEASTRYLTESDLAGKSAEELKIIRNEIFARHGYIFTTPSMKDYFSKQSWYKPTANDVNSMLTPIEIANIALIKEYEKSSQTQPIQLPPLTPQPTVTPLLPTATPQPTVTPLSPTPTPLTGKPPLIKLAPDLPPETDSENLDIQGVVLDEAGIQDVTVTVRHSGEKGLSLMPPVEIEQTETGQFKFHQKIQLGVGQNTIVIEVRDASGQVMQREFPIVRNVAAESGAQTKPALTPSPNVAPDAQAAPRNVYAVIIGIGKYQDQRIPSLRYTVSDAQGLYDVLTDPNYGGVPKDHVKLLLDQDATDRNIKGAIGHWLSWQAQEEDTVIIYYSGHGAPEGGDTYWVTVNADIDSLYTTALNNKEISDMLMRIQAKRVIIFLDSCYSAATVNRTNQTRSVQTEIPWDKFSGAGRVTISASDGKQLSLEMDQYQHGVFTYYLLEGLKGKADTNRDGVVDVDEIWNYVKDQVTETARQAGNPQTPVFQGMVTAGIPLTLNMEVLREKQHADAIKQKQDQVLALLQQGKIQPQHFDCVFKMISSGEANILIDGLLAGTISPEVFNAAFTCAKP
jgi:uncharacterized caspase-like protein/TolB-like protein